ncbi:hypothetical protein ACC761_39755, partial [Rhizobium ruizarguesonis]
DEQIKVEPHQWRPAIATMIRNDDFYSPMFARVVVEFQPLQNMFCHPDHEVVLQHLRSLLKPEYRRVQEMVEVANSSTQLH